MSYAGQVTVCVSKMANLLFKFCNTIISSFQHIKANNTFIAVVSWNTKYVHVLVPVAQPIRNARIQKDTQPQVTNHYHWLLSFKHWTIWYQHQHRQQYTQHNTNLHVLYMYNIEMQKKKAEPERQRGWQGKREDGKETATATSHYSYRVKICTRIPGIHLKCLPVQVNR